MTEADETTIGVGFSPAERDPDLPLVIIDLSVRRGRGPTGADATGEPVTEPIRWPMARPLPVSTTEPIGMPPRPPTPEPPTPEPPTPEPPTPERSTPEASTSPPGPRTTAGPDRAGARDEVDPTVPIRRPADLDASDDEPTGVIGPVDPPTVPLASTTATLPIRLPPAQPDPRPAGRVRARARVYPRWRRRTGTVVAHRRRWRKESLRRWEAVVWIVAVGVVATMAGFVIRSVPTSRPFVAGAVATLPAPPIVPSGQTCVIHGCPAHYPPGPPTRVRIPDIGVDSSLESLTLDKDKVLSAPVRYDEAGWYAKGVVPGDPGPAVIAGHVDSIAGPGVFFKLRTLVPGAAVIVERGGRWVTFRVYQVTEYPKDEFPTDLVYRPTPDPELRVITCGGDFDHVHGRYYDNVVVYARLAS